MTTRKRPFAEAKQLSKGWYAIARVGRTSMASGPWDTEYEAEQAAARWNDAVDLN